LVSKYHVCSLESICYGTFFRRICHLHNQIYSYQYCFHQDSNPYFYSLRYKHLNTKN
jgi:hypothetical protein